MGQAVLVTSQVPWHAMSMLIFRSYGVALIEDWRNCTQSVWACSLSVKIFFMLLGMSMIVDCTSSIQTQLMEIQGTWGQLSIKTAVCKSLLPIMSKLCYVQSHSLLTQPMLALKLEWTDVHVLNDRKRWSARMILQALECKAQTVPRWRTCGAYGAMYFTSSWIDQLFYSNSPRLMSHSSMRS